MNEKTYDDIRAELASELQYVTDERVVGTHYRNFVDKMVEAAMKKFDAAVEDKKRQLELGELADKFFQRIKLNDK